MPMQAGTRLGLYEIVALIGAGGMGEVYRARDTKLGRSVAVKILPEAYASDPDRIARFEREAKVLASLNHPQIAALHGMEESAGRHFLVMELVEGDTLADRIAAAGRARVAPAGLEVDEALSIARQIAQALEAAHEQGIVHRDLKPANIKLRSDGAVKVLDFGLAKAVEATAGVRTDLSTSPTLTTPAMTQIGVILGTAAYMSPEQAKGRPADKRSDIWAFGCVLYEMLTGKRAFEGDDVPDTLAAVLKGEPDCRALPADVPAGIRALIQSCLRKDRRERIGDISTALFLLNQPPATPDLPVSDPISRPLWARAVPVVVGLLVGAAATAALLWTPKRSAPAAVTRFSIAVPLGQQLGLARQALAISPDGTRIVYAANGRLYLRSMSELEPREMPGTVGAMSHVFSPDGQALAFWSDGAIRRISIGGGAAVTVYATKGTPSGISWGDNGIVFVQALNSIMQVEPNGGKPQTLVDLKALDLVVNGPQLLPGGRSVLFTLARTKDRFDLWEKGQIVVQSLDTGERKTIVEGGTDARYVPTGHIVYASGGTLLAVPFDIATRTATAGAVSIVEGVRRATAISSGAAQFAFSNSGSLVYLPGPMSPGQLDAIVFDRTGAAEALKLPPGAYQSPRVSPDGKRVAFETSDRKDVFVSIYELSGASAPRRLTFGGGSHSPIWSADGRHVAFQSDRDGDSAVFWQPADGGTAERLTKPEPGTSHTPESWSPTDDVFLFSATRGSESSLWIFSMRDRKATPFSNVKSTTFPTDAAFSPDGRWVAYQIGEASAGEGTTFVEPFPPTGAKYQIARGGRPQWSRDGGELFYVPAPGQFMAVAVRTQPSFTFSKPVAVPRMFGVADPAAPRPYDTLPDGRFVGIGTADQTAAAPAQIHVILDWFEDLRMRAPAR